MATRCTPFGLFAGVTLGEIAEDFDLRVCAAENGVRQCRIDQDAIARLQEHLLRDAEDATTVLRDATLSMNSSFWWAPDGLRYAECVRDGDETYYRLAKMDWSEALERVTRLLASAPAPFRSLAADLARAFDIDLSAIEEFLAVLVREQILISSPQVTITGDDSVRRFVEDLSRNFAIHTIAAPLRAASSALDKVSISSENNIQLYADVTTTLLSLNAEVAAQKTIQVDFYKRGTRPQIPKAAVEDVLSQLWSLRALLVSKPADDLQVFAAEFAERYGDAKVPLQEALDPDFGIAFGSGSQLVSPLLRQLKREPRPAGGAPRQILDDFLFRCAETALLGGHREIVLTDDALEEFTNVADDMPSSFSVLGTFDAEGAAALKSGKYSFELTSISGTPASALFGRFCCGDAEIAEQVRAFIRETEGDVGDTIIAEIAHQPAGRIGNVMLRPVMREHEIPYLGQSGAAPEMQIAVADLDISCRDGRVTFTSRSLNKRVLPRITNAHAFLGVQNLPIYKFFGLLQYQDEPVPRVLWGELSDRAGFLPGLQYRKIRLSYPRWRLDHDALRVLAKADSSGSEALLQSLPGARGVRHVRLRQGDNFLELDLEEALDRALFLEECRRKQSLILEDVGRSVNALAADTHGRTLRHEVAIPVFRVHPARRSPVMESDLAALRGPAAYGPGGEWLYARVFCGTSMMDRIITEIFPAFARFAESTGAVTPYFIRYWQSGQHLRLRVRGDGGNIWGPIRKKLENMLAPHLSNRSISRFEYATYQPEYRRYGGYDGLRYCKAIFAADSIAVAQALLAMGPDAADLRWRFALASVRGIFQAMDIGEDGAIAIVNAMLSGYFTEFKVGKSERDVLNERYREYRPIIDTIVAGEPTQDATIAQALDDRLATLRPQAAALKTAVAPDSIAAIVASLVHMSANRIFPEQLRMQEMVLLHFYAKSATSLMGRRKFQSKK